MSGGDRTGGPAGAPRWRDLPELPDGARSASSRAPAGDRLGRLRLLTPERTADAVRLVRTGRRIRPDLPLGQWTRLPFDGGPGSLHIDVLALLGLRLASCSTWRNLADACAAEGR